MTEHLHAGDRPWVALLDHDPDLGSAVPEAEFEHARRRAVARTVDFSRQGWDPHALAALAGPGWLGLCVLDGLLVRSVLVGKRAACELFGPGDLIRPWDADGEYEPLTIKLEWRVLEGGRLALLDEQFVLRTARWPSINSQLVSRIARRARHLALSQAVTHLPRVHSRLLILFWLLAERWGNVTPEGIRISLPLTHELLGMLAGAHRPTVTLALQRLSDAGLLVRQERDRWLLTKLAIERISDPERADVISDASDDIFAPGVS